MPLISPPFPGEAIDPDQNGTQPRETIAFSDPEYLG